MRRYCTSTVGEVSKLMHDVMRVTQGIGEEMGGSSCDEGQKSSSLAASEGYPGIAR